MRRARASWEGIPVAELEARWGVPLVEAHEHVPSTNDLARDLASRGALPFTIVLAEAQSDGRGRRGRPWHSPPGMGLWMSLVLRPPAGDAGRRLLPLLVGLAVARAAERAAPGVRAGLKWPNDVLVEGRKVAGVLCEAAGPDAVVAGVGVNVRVGATAALPPAVRAAATSLEAARGAGVDRACLAGSLVEEARRLLDVPFPRLEGALAREVAQRDVLRGRRVRLDDGAEGLGGGLAADGALLVERGGSVHAVVAGGVRLVGR